MRFLALALGRVVPGHGLYELVARLFGVLVELLDPAPQMVDEPGVAPRVARRLDGLVVPLQHALGLGEGAVLLGDERRGDEEDLRGALLGVYALHLPGGGGLYLVGVEDHEPVQVPQAVLGHLDVRPADREVLPEDEAALHVPVLHVHDRRVVGVVAREAREVVEDLVAPLGVEGLAVPGLEQAGYVLGEVVPPARLGGLVSPRSRPRCRCPCSRRASAGSRGGCCRGSLCPSSPGSSRGPGAP